MQTTDYTDILFATLLQGIDSSGTKVKPAVWKDSFWQELSTGNWDVSNVAFKPNGEMWLIGSKGNVGIYDETNKSVTNIGLLGGKELTQLIFDYNGDKYGVTTDNQLLKWPNAALSWEDFSFGWSVSSIAIDNTGQIWCAGSKYNIGKLNAAQNGWDNIGLKGDWDIRQLVYSDDGGLLCVGSKGNIGQWDPATNSWCNLGAMGGSAILFMTIKSVMQISDIQYDIAKATISNVNTSIVHSKTYYNGTDQSQQEDFEYSCSETHSSTFTWNKSDTLSFSITAKLKIPLIEETKVTVGASQTVSVGGAKSNSVTKQLTWKDPLSVPAHSKVTEQASLSSGSVNVPYTATLTYKGNAHTRTGTYSGSNDYNIVVRSHQEAYEGTTVSK